MASLETADIETSSDAYAARFFGPVGEYFLDVQTRHVLDLISPWPASPVLDVGGGHGQLALPLADKGFQVTIAGSSPVCEARLARSLAPGSYAFRVCDLLELPFAARSFDVVLAFRLLPHVARWQQLVAELCRVARHAVIVDYPDIRSVNVIGDRLLHVKKAVEEGNVRPFTCYSKGEILGAFGANGFGTPTFRPQFTVPMAVHRMLRSAGLSRAMEAAARGVGLTRRVGSPVIVRLLRST
jgi:SAM-dependent methyltransferase